MIPELLNLIEEVRESAERFDLEKIHLQHEIYKTILQYDNLKLSKGIVNDITGKYEGMVKLNNLFVEILKRGDEEDFINWLNNGEDLGEDRERIYREVLLPEIIKYERYSWVKHLKL